MASTSSIPLLTVTLELGGGTELLTANKKQKKHVLKVPSQVYANELSRESEASAGISDGQVNGSTATTDEEKKRRPVTMFDLIQMVCRDVIVERHGMLVEPDGSMKPGILVLINDVY